MKIKHIRAAIEGLDGEMDVGVVDRECIGYGVASTSVEPLDDDGAYGDDAKPGWSPVFLIHAD